MPFGELKFDDDGDDLVDEQCEFCGKIGEHADDCIYVDDFDDVAGAGEADPDDTEIV